MSIFNEAYITELFGLLKKKPKTSPKPPKEESYSSGTCKMVEVSLSDKAIFEKLYNNEALTAEGMAINGDEDLEKINKWFRTNSKPTASNIDIYVITGKAMNTYYHLTDDNAYPDDDYHIVCIDWIKSGVRTPYKGSWRWFSDVVDNNARREIAKGNHHYDHYDSIYYGAIGLKD